jgi:hypothetical protein
MPEIRKKVGEFDNNLDTLITLVKGDSQMGDIVFIDFMEEGKPPGDDLVVMKVRQFLKLLVPGEVAASIAMTATDRGGG